MHLQWRRSGRQFLAAAIASTITLVSFVGGWGSSPATRGIAHAQNPAVNAKGHARASVQITLGYAGGANIDPYYKQIIAAAEKALPGITVKTVVYSTYDDQLNSMPQQMAAGTIPDVIVWDNSAPVAQYASEHAIRTLNSLVKQAKINLGVYPSALVKSWKISGNLYGIPSYLQNSAFVYNLDLFKQAGIKKLPSSMAQVASDAKTVKSKTGQAGLVILDNLFHLTQYVLAYGGGWHYGKTIDSKQNRAGLQFLVNLFNNGSAIIPKQAGATWDGEAIANGKAAMSDGGPWYIGFMKSTAPKVHYKMQPIPLAKGGQFVVTYGGAYTITSHAHDPASAIKLIKYLTNAQSENAILTSSLGFVPAMKKYVTVYRKQTPQYAPITNKILASGRNLAYPKQTTQFENDLVAGFENIVFRHSGSVSSLLSSLQKTYGS